MNAASAAYFYSFDFLVRQTANLSDSLKCRLYDSYFLCLRAGHAGQALDINGLDYMMDNAVASGKSDDLEAAVKCTHMLKSAVPAGSLARVGAIIGNAPFDVQEKLGRYFESIGVAFQIIDDVLNLVGLPGKTRGEDITAGKVTYPVAKAMSRLPLEERQWLWNTVKSKPEDPAVVASVITKLEQCGAIAACNEESDGMVEKAWQELDPVLAPSFSKLLLRTFGWYVLSRHY